MGVLKDDIERFLGNGKGNGYGSGYGYGYGYGSGYGYGDGYGYGNGNGNGNGNGDGYGDGYGKGNGIKSFDGHDVYNIDNVPTIIESIKGNMAKGYTIKNNCKLIPCYIAKVDGFFAHGDTAHKAYNDAMAKAMQNMPIEKRIERVIQQYPNVDELIEHKELFKLHNMLTGSCKFGRKQFCEQHGLDPNNGSMTMREFINLTLNAYGGNNIKALAKAYGL